MAMETLSDYAVWGLTAVSAYLGKLTLDNGKALDAYKLEAERLFQRKDGLKEIVTEAVQLAIAPMMAKIEAHDAKIDQALDELDSQRKDLNTILDKFHVPAVDRHG